MKRKRQRPWWKTEQPAKLKFWLQDGVPRFDEDASVKLNVGKTRLISMGRTDSRRALGFAIGTSLWDKPALHFALTRIQVDQLIWYLAIQANRLKGKRAPGFYRKIAHGLLGGAPAVSSRQARP